MGKPGSLPVPRDTATWPCCRSPMALHPFPRLARQLAEVHCVPNSKHACLCRLHLTARLRTTDHPPTFSALVRGELKSRKGIQNKYSMRIKKSASHASCSVVASHTTSRSGNSASADQWHSCSTSCPARGCAADDPGSCGTPFLHAALLAQWWECACSIQDWQPQHTGRVHMLNR